MSKVAIIQFPGSNTERETFIACARNNINAVEFLWNDDHNKFCLLYTSDAADE